MAQTADAHAPAEYPVVTRRQVFTEDVARRVAAMLHLSGKEWPNGAAVPIGWHFPLFGAESGRSSAQSDGFSGLGLSFPYLPRKRLVAGGRSVESMGTLRIGQPLERNSQIASIVPKSTAQGQLTIVTTQHEVRDFQDRSLILQEKQTFLLLDTLFVATQAVPSKVEHGIIKTVTPDDTILFQFSALSFNTHKIHLDRDYARNSEGYPDLVVNGGMTTLFMTEIARSGFGDSIKRLTVRNKAPLFCNRPIHFAQSERSGSHIIIALDDEGSIAAEMEFETNDL